MRVKSMYVCVCVFYYL